ncbi:MAG: ATP synthase F1 subunit delta [Aquificae bacterium]|nr:ATP synthase F1 subunit delta [Aquificota bacterium]
MKVDKKVLKRVTKILLNKVPKEEEVILKVLKDLEIISALYKKSTEFRNLILSPSIELQTKEKILNQLFQELKINDIVKQAVFYLVKIGKGNIIKELDKSFKFEVERFFATVQGEIITAYPLEESYINKIKNLVEKRIGKKVEFEIKEDKSLIGGVVVKAGSYVLDASIRFFIKKLQQQLTQV